MRPYGPRSIGRPCADLHTVNQKVSLAGGSPDDVSYSGRRSFSVRSSALSAFEWLGRDQTTMRRARARSLLPPACAEDRVRWVVIETMKRHWPVLEL